MINFGKYIPFKPLKVSWEDHLKVFKSACINPNRPSHSQSNGVFTNLESILLKAETIRWEKELWVVYSKENEIASAFTFFSENREFVNIIKIFNVPQPVIITSSNSGIDNKIWIFSLLGDYLCCFNMDTNLPFRWRLLWNLSHFWKEKT